MSHASIVIPAYEPTPALADLVATLSRDGRPIVVVDDGSSAAVKPIFDRVAAMPNVTLLVHAVNLGKGQALKTAFNHFLLHAPADSVGVVTADADGQHMAADIRRVAERLEQSPSTLVLGSRGFEGRVPLRSRFGNTVTRGVFRLLLGRPIVDTQTGLRGIPRSFLPELLAIEAGRYEFELEMLVRATAKALPIAEVRIETVYGGVGQSHFNPLRDSLRIYFVFLRFLGLSLATAGLDYLVFVMTFIATHNILGATALARGVAGTFNFSYNRAFVFQSRGEFRHEAVKYTSLVFALMWVSYALLTVFVTYLGIQVYVAKLIADGTLFVASFAIQNLFVFSDRGRAATRSQTDWDAYHEHPAALARVTRPITAHAVVDSVGRYASTPPAHIVELGGANSGFLDALHLRYPTARLTAIDTYVPVVSTARIPVINRDVLAPVVESPGADVVLSVGLIEHFDREGTARAIASHFAYARPGGLVVMTYPTPTWLYRIVRGAAERLGVWRFPDERPLMRDEVEAEIDRHGRVLFHRTLWAIVLTQGLVVACKSKSIHIHS